MPYQTVFRRYELKYLLTEAQRQAVLAAMAPYMTADAYGRSTVRNVYFDTDTYRLIRRSLEKPVYKEKLRMRSYAAATPDGTVFAELKKKYDGVVYKRRLALYEREVTRWFAGGERPVDTQIAREIDYFLTFYGRLSPKMFLSYEREAYYETAGETRVTFDTHILARDEQVSLCAPVYGTPLLEPGQTLMEIKCAGGMPLWLARTLSREHIGKTSFSKYGAAYRRLILPARCGENMISNKEYDKNASYI